MVFAHMRSKVHAGRVEPAEERCVGPGMPLHKIDRGGRSLVVDSFHPLFGERAGVLYRLTADFAPARLFSGVVAVRCLASQDATGAEHLTKSWLTGIRTP